MKRLFLVIVLWSFVFLVFICCDSKMKRCTYDVYQHGKLLPQQHIRYIRRSEWCEGYSREGILYMLDKVETVSVKDIVK